MYEEYYGFVQPPFSLTPDPRFLYRSESHEVALQQVWQAIRRKEGFIVLTGDIGTGKTTLSRTILEQFDPTTFTALILNPFLTVDELLREVLLIYGIASKEALRGGRLAAASKAELVRTLHDFLLSLVPIHGSAVLIIDEAQHLSPEVLEEIRILSNLETNEQKLLQIILVGQLNLLDVLHDAKLRQLDQRISIRCLLKPLTRDEVEAYITHRLAVARGSRAVTFTPRAIDVVHAISGGVPRIINLLCDRALMSGAQAQTDQITESFIDQAAGALDLAAPQAAQPPRRRRLRVALVLLTILLLLALAAAAYLLGNPLGFRAEQPNVTAPVAPAPPQPAAPASAEPLPGMPPAVSEGAFTVLVGTYDDSSEAAAAEQVLRALGLPAYAIDLPFTDGVRRRILVGRYATREDAEKVRAALAGRFDDARTITSTAERFL